MPAIIALALIAIAAGPQRATPGEDSQRGDKGPWWSAGDLKLVDDDRDAARHPRDAAVSGR